ncbi:MAG: methyltransferase domain-containing protein [Anaerolineae bacterium]|nr:methyltransferase domain-containing protein [Anaerolineae bacterium]
MYNHAPKDYVCPFCLLVQSIENEHNAIKQTDLVYQNDRVTAFIALRKWPNNIGHVLIIPNEHFENIYDLPIGVSTEIQKTAQAIALTMKEVYSCDGIMILQRNEPAGDQRAWHYHLHVIPRYENDNWPFSQRLPFPADERAEYAQRLKAKIEAHLPSSNVEKMESIRYAPAQHWDRKFSTLHQAGKDLDWGNQWIEPFIKPLHQAGCRTVLDLGCGTGNEVSNLSKAGFEMTGLDYSKVGVCSALSKAGSKAAFVVADMSYPLPFHRASFDAVMSNVAAHMFSDRITRTLFAEVRRVLRPQGLFLFHLNALEDRPFRAWRKPEVCEIEKNYILEQDGQTMHFFSEAYLLELLTGWQDVNLELVKLPGDMKMDYLPKRVWRGMVRR